jgi:hypothetical protein
MRPMSISFQRKDAKGAKSRKEKEERKGKKENRNGVLRIREC